MPARPRLASSRWSALYRLAAVLAVVAQCVLVLSSVGEGRAGIGQAAHVESSQNATPHYAHDEATCAACQARTLLTVPLRAPQRFVAELPVHATLTGAPGVVPAVPALHGNPTRAPPSVI